MTYLLWEREMELISDDSLSELAVCEELLLDIGSRYVPCHAVGFVFACFKPVNRHRS